MENEVSGIAKLGIVLIALAVLIGLGFGIFQIAKSTANDGVGQVQEELDSVSTSAFTTYDQTTITGTMASSAITDFEGENVAVLVATSAWSNLVFEINTDATHKVLSQDDLASKGSGLNVGYTDNDNGVPVVLAFTTAKANDVTPITATTGNGDNVALSFVNYNAILGNAQVEDAAGTSDARGLDQTADFTSYLDKDGAATDVHMGCVYFDSNCYRCVSGFAVTDGGKTIFNNVTSNIGKTGRTEYIPSGAKFDSYLVKDASGTYIGVAFQQLAGV